MSYEEDRQKALEEGLLPEIGEERAKEFAKRGWRFDVLFSPAEYARERFEGEIPEGAIVLRPGPPQPWERKNAPGLNIDQEEVFAKREYLPEEENLPFEIEERAIFSQDESYIHLIDEGWT